MQPSGLLVFKPTFVAGINRICFLCVLPNIVLGLLQMPRENIHRFPAADAHDRGCVVARAEKVLRGTQAHGMTAQGIDL